jgi:DDB1- and CUL4-associated factor 7
MLMSSTQQSKVQGQSGGAPLTNFSWNEKVPSLVVTSSIDTTCTVWNLDTSTAVTQLIAHDREVYDVAWLPNSTDIFVSVGADGSLRAFDLRSLEHSTILYETPPPKNQPPSGRPPSSPLLRIAFNPSDANYMSTFHQDGTDVQILDMRSPGAPVMELRAHRAPINAAGWSSTEGGLVATAGVTRLILRVVVPDTSSCPHPTYSGRLPVTSLGHLTSRFRARGVAAQCQLTIELPEAGGREKAGADGPDNGVYGAE